MSPLDRSTLDQIVATPPRGVRAPTVSPAAVPPATDDTVIPRQFAEPVTRGIEPTSDEITGEEEPSGLLAAFIQMRVALGDLSREMATRRQFDARLLARLEQNTPIKHPRANSVVAKDSNITGVADWIDLGSPTEGFYWSLESCFVGGVDVNTTAAIGTVGLYVTTSRPTALQNQSPGTGSAVDFFSTLPAKGFYGGREVVVNHGDHLVIGLWHATANQEYRANAVFSVYNVASARGRTENVAGL